MRRQSFDVELAGAFDFFIIHFCLIFQNTVRTVNAVNELLKILLSVVLVQSSIYAANKFLIFSNVLYTV